MRRRKRDRGHSGRLRKITTTSDLSHALTTRGTRAHFTLRLLLTMPKLYTDVIKPFTTLNSSLALSWRVQQLEVRRKIAASLDVAAIMPAFALTLCVLSLQEDGEFIVGTTKEHFSLKEYFTSIIGNATLQARGVHTIKILSFQNLQGGGRETSVVFTHSSDVPPVSNILYKHLKIIRRSRYLSYF